MSSPDMALLFFIVIQYVFFGIVYVVWGHFNELRVNVRADFSKQTNKQCNRPLCYTIIFKKVVFFMLLSCWKFNYHVNFVYGSNKI